MKPVVSAGRVIFLTLIFTAISALGIWLIYLTIDSPRAGENSRSEARLHMDSRLPGIIVFAIGASGLVLMMIKIPVQRILSVEHPKGPSDGDGADKMRPIVELAEEIEYIPLFSWLVLLIFRRGTVKRVLFELPGDVPDDLLDELLDDLPDDT